MVKETETYYDEKSEGYDEAFDMLYFKVFDVVTWKYLEPYVPMKRDAIVLDAGGGTGRWTIQMAGKGCRIVLMDSSRGMLEVAAEKIKRAGFQGNVSIRQGDIAETGYSDEAFDMIFCEHALFLFKNPDIVIKELTRVLRKNGYLIISAQNRYVQSLAMLPGKPSTDDVDRVLKNQMSRSYVCMALDGRVKVYTWTPNEFRTMLERNGLQVEKIIGKGITMPLRIRKETYTRKDYPEDFFKKILELELALCEKEDALALAGHLQATTRKK